MNKEIAQEIINTLEIHFLAGEFYSYTCHLSRDPEYRELCHQYLTALNKEHGGIYDGDEYQTLSACFYPGKYTSIQEERKKMIQWLLSNLKA